MLGTLEAIKHHPSFSNHLLKGYLLASGKIPSKPDPETRPLSRWTHRPDRMRPNETTRRVERITRRHDPSLTGLPVRSAAPESDPRRARTTQKDP